MAEIAKKASKKQQTRYLPDLEPTCSHCGSEDVFGMSRVVGYFSVIENWNNSKKAELKRRQKGEYWSDKEA
ncbi:MAG: anaerobic ribonucleoside-triphosphate reductase [Candidatus Heimdallarchaeota archaeon]